MNSSVAVTANGDVLRNNFPRWLLEGQADPGPGGMLGMADRRFDVLSTVTHTGGIGSADFYEELTRAVGELDRFRVGPRNLLVQVLEQMQSVQLEVRGLTLASLRQLLPDGLKIPDYAGLVEAYSLYLHVIVLGDGTLAQKGEAMALFVPPAYFNKIVGGLGENISVFGDGAAIENMVKLPVYFPGEGTKNLIGLPGDVSDTLNGWEGQVGQGRGFYKTFSRITFALAWIKLGADPLVQLFGVKDVFASAAAPVTLEKSMSTLDRSAESSEEIVVFWDNAKDNLDVEMRDGEANAERRRKAIRKFNMVVETGVGGMSTEERNNVYREFYGLMQESWKVDFLFEYLSEVFIGIMAIGGTIPDSVKKFYLLLFGVYRQNIEEVSLFLVSVARR